MTASFSRFTPKTWCGGADNAAIYLLHKTNGSRGTRENRAIRDGKMAMVDPLLGEFFV